jgi:phosphate transport system substrate-binding protein
MKFYIWLKIVVLIIITLAVSFIGFIMILVSAFSGDGNFISPLVFLLSIITIIYFILLIIKIVRPKILSFIYAGILLAFVITFSIYYLNKNYIKNIPTISQEVNLDEYEPFTKNTKAIKMNTTASLKITENLPIIDGATALYPLYSAFVQAVYPQKEYNIIKSEVRCNNTINAYESLINGDVDIIFTARPSKDQIEKAKEKGIEFILTPIGREAFVFFVNSKNKIDSLKLVEIQQIYSGDIKNWKELGGKNKEIRAFQRTENSGSQTMLQKIMDGKKLIKPIKEDQLTLMGEIIAQTSDYKNFENAIGFSFLFYTTKMVNNKKIKLLKINGVSPLRSTIKDKTYPLTADFYAVTAMSNKMNIKLFIDWILSPEGQAIVEKTGYTPIR